MAVGEGMTGIGSFAKSAVEALGEVFGSGEHLALIPDGTRGSLRLPSSFRALHPNGAGPLWRELALPTILADREIDIFFSPHFSCPVVRGARHVVTLHDVFPESHPELCTGEFLAFWKARLAPSLRSASHTVAVSEWSKRCGVEHLRIPEERISVVRQSVGANFRTLTSEKSSPAAKKHGLSRGQYVLYLGALDPRKNLERLIGAFAQLSAPELVLAIAGESVSSGYDLPAAAERAGIAEKVRLLGRVPDGDLAPLYAGARCFAFPSLAEGFGRPVIEAMSCGVPVVASDRTALPETCGDAALLPDPEDVEAITDALRTACFEDAQRARLAAAGKKRAAEFSDERFGADLRAAFEAAMNGPGDGLWSA
jgi:alpha-1,3-rhamnosyl/mannosyltransferase